MTRAVAPFTLDVTSFEQPYATRDGVDYARAHFDKTFHGDLEASSSVEMLFVTAEAGRGYVALETIDGSLGGRTGTFALLHCGTMAGDDVWATWPIVAGSGTGGLAGITGEARIDIADDGAHTLVLDYEL